MFKLERNEKKKNRDRLASTTEFTDRADFQKLVQNILQIKANIQKSVHPHSLIFVHWVDFRARDSDCVV